MRYILAIGLLLSCGWAWSAATTTDTTIPCNGTNPCNPDVIPITPPTNDPPAEGYFVDCANGNDINNGTSPSSPWQTLTKVNNATIATSTDVWLKAGVVCPAVVLTIDWAGIDSDRAVIGSYYVGTDNKAYQSLPSNFTVSTRPRDYIYPHGRAIIEGSYHDSCRTDWTWWQFYDFTTDAHGKCAWDGGTAGGVHYFTLGTRAPNVSGDLTPIVFVKQKYVTVQDLEVRDSAAGSINADSVPHISCLNNNVVCAYYLIIQRNYVHNIAGQGVGCSNVSHCIVRYNRIDSTQLAAPDNQPGRGIIRAGSGISSTGSYPSQQLWEGNDIGGGVWGEGIGPYGLGFVLIRGNQVAGAKGQLNMGGDANIVAEQNMFIGSKIGETDKAYTRTTYQNSDGGNGADFGGNGSDATGYENPDSGPTVAGMFAAQNGINTLRRNNLLAAMNTCYGAYTLVSYTAPEDFVSFDLKEVGNTCFSNMDADSRAVGYSFQGPSFVNFVTFEGNLNVITNAALAGSMANITTKTFDYNQWSVASSAGMNAVIRSPGTHDVYSTNTGLPASTPSSWKWTNMPSESDFKPTGGAGLNVGPILTGAANASMSDANWDWVFSQMMWLPGAAACPSARLPTRAEWNQLLATDYCGQVRGVATSIGAFD